MTNPFQSFSFSFSPRGLRKRRFSLLLIIVLIIGMITAGSGLTALFQSYRNALVESQKDQLSNISESVANTIAVYLENYQQSAESMVSVEQFHDAVQQFSGGSPEALHQFLDQVRSRRSEDIACLIYEGADGSRSFSGTEHSFRLHKNLGSGTDFQELCIDLDEENEFYFRILAAAGDGGRLLLYLPLRTIYEKTASTIHMGSKGYVMIKDSDGIILMHPVERQIGIDVLDDRRKLYPDYDYSELEVLIEHQLAGQRGVEIYHSYWWADDPPTSVQKISAYLPLHLGEDFLSISAVIDYSEITEPLQSVGIQILLVTILLVVSLLGFLFLLLSMFYRQQRIEQENDRLKQINENLERLREQEENLAQQQRLQLIGTMTSGIAHEFNNLLTPIMGYSAMILSGMSEEDENYPDMQEIYGSAEKAKEIIDQVTQFSRKNAEKMFEPIHIGEAARKALVITEAAKPRNIRLVSRLDTERDICMGNPVQIYQMVVNLCNNAVQAIGTAEGTVTIQGAAIQPRNNRDAFFRGKEEKWFYRLSVSDTGCGMDQETIDQIFVPFFTTKKPGEGTGLGLSIVQRLVDAHGGYICVHSTPGQGAEFVIYLPLLEIDDAVAEPYQQN